VKKIFVGGVKEAISDEDLRNYFCSFGNVQSVEMIADRETGRKRGFGFITFDDYDTVDKIVRKFTGYSFLNAATAVNYNNSCITVAFQ
jgi:RNA recognition motif-containing protein